MITEFLMCDLLSIGHICFIFTLPSACAPRERPSALCRWEAASGNTAMMPARLGCAERADCSACLVRESEEGGGPPAAAAVQAGRCQRGRQDRAACRAGRREAGVRDGGDDAGNDAGNDTGDGRTAGGGVDAGTAPRRAPALRHAASAPNGQRGRRWRPRGDDGCLARHGPH